MGFVCVQHISLLRIEDASDYFFFLFPLRAGTFPPARRASDSPIAIACFRLVTFFPERPLFNLPFFRSCIARLTFCWAFLPYRAMTLLLSVSCGSAQLA